MPVQIQITGDDANQAIAEFAVLSAAFTATPVPNKEEAPKRTRQSRQTSPEKTEPKAETTKEPEETKPAEKESSGDENIPTDVELRAKAKEVGTTAGKKAAIKALLTEYGVSNITAVPEEQRVAFMAALEKI